VAKDRIPLWPVLVPIAVVGALAVGAATVLGAFGPTEPDPPPAGAAPDPCPRDDPDGAVVRPNRFTGVGAPYDGPGPHLLTVVTLTRGGGAWQGRGAGPDPDPDPSVPVDWRAPSFNGWDPADVELVVCKYRVDRGEVVGTCRYDGGVERPLVGTVYAHRVFEARTGEPVTGFELRGGGGCPAPGGPQASPVVQEVVQQDFVERMRTAVEGSR
jgi:hypothetical protein